MFKKENISKTVILWLLLGLAFSYVSYNIILAGAFFVLAVVLGLMWKKKFRESAISHSETTNSKSQYIFLFFLSVMVFFINDLKTFYPPGNAMLLGMSVVLYGAIGMMILSIVLAKTK